MNPSSIQTTYVDCSTAPVPAGLTREPELLADEMRGLDKWLMDDQASSNPAPACLVIAAMRLRSRVAERLKALTKPAQENKGKPPPAPVAVTYDGDTDELRVALAPEDAALLLELATSRTFVGRLKASGEAAGAAAILRDIQEAIRKVEWMPSCPPTPAIKFAVTQPPPASPQTGSPGQAESRA